MNTLRPLFFCLLSIVFIACNDDDYTNSDSDCNDVACTEIFVTLTVTVKDASGIVIPLDNFKVVNASNNEDLTRELSVGGFEMASQNVIYPLFGDEYVSRFQNKSLDIIFKGFIDGNEVINDTFKVGADCCHVELLAGDTAILIEN